MATTRRNKGTRRSTKRNGSASRSKRGASARANGRSARAGNGKQMDAIALLKADHREVEGLFEQFEKSRSDSKKQQLAQRICVALRAHTTIEEEIFYPAFLEATDDSDTHHEAEIEHEGATRLIEQIEASGPDDDYFDSKVKVLKEMIKHHVNEEEKRGGMFTEARSSDMDLESLGEQLRARKQQLMAESGGEDGSGPSRGGRGMGMASKESAEKRANA
jgi:hemerythrin superfamily protein